MTPSISRSARLIASLAIAAAAAALAGRTAEAHKPITSKYTYNEDVFPILREKCGRCHVEGGVAPMSLMTYEEAFPWAESIRVELIASHMPPWNAQRDFGALKHANLLTAAELDAVLTWATGGNPRGALGQQAAHVALENDWPMGPPDLTLALPNVTIDADSMEKTQDFVIPTGTQEARWLRAVDLLPGTPSVVRSAVIALKGDDAVPYGPEQVLRRWVPGQDVESIDRDGAALRLPANMPLVVSIHYKKTWKAEGQPLKDASTVGLYFVTDKHRRDLLTLPISAPADSVSTERTLTFSRTLDREARALAFTPDQVPPNITLAASAMLPSGTRVPLIRLHTRQDWARRYWFETPITLPGGTQIEVVADFEDPDHLTAQAFGGFAPVKRLPAEGTHNIRVSLDVTTATRASSP